MSLYNNQINTVTVSGSYKVEFRRYRQHQDQQQCANGPDLSVLTL